MSDQTGRAIVIGAGQNGLACAARLAAAGREVLVLERSGAVGGLAAAREFHPGYRVPGILHDEGLLEPKVAARLGLETHGLRFRETPPVLLAGAPGETLLLDHDPARAAGELAAFSARDAESYRRYRAFFSRLRPLAAALTTTPPPPLSPAGAGDLWEVAAKGLALWRLGRRESLELLRVAPMCVADFLNERFETALLVEGLAAPAVTATWAGPWSAGTNTSLLLAEAAPGRHLTGGPAALVSALERAARAAGATIRTGAEVARIEVADNRARGVVLTSGEAVNAGCVIATCDPQRALLGLVPAGTLPIRIEDEFRRIRLRGTAAKLHLALSGPLEIAGRAGQPCERIRLGGGHVDQLERAFDAVKYGEVSAAPHLEIRVPTVADPALAPAGHHVASVLVSYVPHALAGGWSEERRAALLESVLARLELHVPELRRRLVASELLTPADLESAFSLTGGQLHHGEPALDQMLVLRPAPSAARYATSVAGLYLGGSGSHPGGGVNCAAGLLAAAAVLGPGLRPVLGQ